MAWVLFVIFAILLIALSRKQFCKIDAETEKALSTPGRAERLRTCYPQLVSYFDGLDNYRVEFERNDLIRFVNDTERIIKKVIIQNWSDRIVVVFTQDNVPYKEWSFKKRDYNDELMRASVQDFLQYKA